MNALAELRRRLAAALVALDPGAVDLADQALPNQDARLGDYQVNCAMPLGKRLGKPPREVAAALLERLEWQDAFNPPEIAGPGFINLRLRDDWICEQLCVALQDRERSGASVESQPKTIVIDYSSPNVAKPMHVGHVRSTVIGDALCRILRFLGHRVISDNHIGDWGSQFGMILYGYKHFVDRGAFSEEPVAELSRLYRLVHQLTEYHETLREKIPALEEKIARLRKLAEELAEIARSTPPGEQKKATKLAQQAAGQVADFEQEMAELQKKTAVVEQSPTLARFAAEHPRIGEAVLQETAALHAGNAENLALWREFLPSCLAEMEAVYERLGVVFDYTLGESFYHGQLAQVVEELARKDIARESDGAMCVFLEGIEAPLIVRKKDGAYLYGTTDLATIAYRLHEWRPDAILYVVDHRQSLHFQQLFAAARRWFAQPFELEHVSFGTVLDDQGRPFKTRSGSAAGLASLLDEAVARAHAIVCANDDNRAQPLLSDSQRRNVAKKVGIGAVKYADLAHNRTSDYKFSYDKMLAMTGNTAAYMQYSYARVRSIFEKGDVDLEALRQRSPVVAIEAAEERALALALLRFEEAIVRAASDYRPNHLTDYLFDLAGRFSTFFENCPVLKADDGAQRASRLLLCDLTAQILAQGLRLLGIEVVERM